LESFTSAAPAHLPAEQGKLQGNCRNGRAKALLARLIGQEIQSLSRKIPCPRQQGICWPRSREINQAKQGISPVIAIGR
jgi:hypothetical protein